MYDTSQVILFISTIYLFFYVFRLVEGKGQLRMKSMATLPDSRVAGTVVCSHLMGGNVTTDENKEI